MFSPAIIASCGITQSQFVKISTHRLFPHGVVITLHSYAAGGNYYHGMFGNPTAAVNLFHVGKQYLTFWQAKAAVTHNLIGRKIISNVKRSDTRNSLYTVGFVKVD